jgi:hypothetical protein
MNSLYLILIGISFTAGVLVASMGDESNAKIKPVCEDKKTKIEDDLKVVAKKDNNSEPWFTSKNK